MPALAKRIEIGDEDRAALERIVRSTTAQVRMVERAQIVLEAGKGRSAAEIGRLLGCSTNTAQKWRARYEQDGIAALVDLPRPGNGWRIIHAGVFQFTPTHASWLNQVEIFFSILYRRLLKHGIFFSEEDLAEQMLAFVETYNQTAKPFKWTYTGKVLEA
jgi:hypothetical protein